MFGLVRTSASLLRSHPSSTSEHGCSLESLPCELFIHLLSSIPDIATLYNFLHASPTAYRVFNRYDAAKTVETILSSGHTCTQIQFLFRFCAKLQFEGVDGWSNETLVKRGFEDPLDVSFINEYSPGPLALNTSLHKIHRLLRIARDIHTVALDCIGDCLRAFCALESQQQQRPAEEESPNRCTTEGQLGAAAAAAGASVATVAVGDEEVRVPRLPRGGGTVMTKAAEQIPCKGMGFGPPPPTAATWAEEQRVERALWRMQLASEADMASMRRFRPPGGTWRVWWFVAYEAAILRQALACQGRHDSDSDIYEPRTALYQAELPNRKIMNPEYRELLSVVDYVGRRFGEDSADDFAGKIVDMEGLLLQEIGVSRPKPFAQGCNPCDSGGDSDDASSQRWWEALMPTAYDEERMSSTSLSENHNEEEPPPRNPSRTGTHAENEGLLKPSAAVSRYLRGRNDTQRPPSIDMFQFSVFYRCGFAFWSEERLRARGFLPTAIVTKTDDTSSLSPSQQSLQLLQMEEEARVDAAWLSLLTPQEIAWDTSKREEARMINITWRRTAQHPGTH